MLKALLKKQFLEFNQFYFMDRKTGKMRSKKSAVGYIVLYAVLLIFLGVTFYFVSSTFAEVLVPSGLTWLYFALMGLLAVFMGVFGGVFNTYAGLYHAKDNELLLSMPIPPSKILGVRMVGVYAMGLMYEAIVFIPTVVGYFVYATPSVLGVVNSILLLFILGVFVLVLVCLLGWVVAVIASKLKNKSFITVILSLALFAVYYYVCMNYYEAVQRILMNIDQVSQTVKGAAYPLYLMGMAADGSPLHMLLFTAIVVALLVLTWYILSKSFIKIATRKDSSAKKVYKEKPAKVKSADRALFKKEWKRFSSSPTYMLNCALGTVLMPVAAVAMLVMSGDVRQTLMVMIPNDVIYVCLPALVCFLASMNDITAPSVSLEGRNIWVLQSMPADSAKVLEAKQKLHWALTMPPAILCTVILCIVVGADFTVGVFSCVIVILYTMLLADLGLIINLKKPNLSWTNETAPVKQSVGVMICLFGGWILALIIGAAGYFTRDILQADNFLIICIVVLAIAVRLLDRWLRTKGSAIFDEL